MALIPRACEALQKVGISILVESGAGKSAGFLDEQYATRGAMIGSRAEVFAGSSVIVQVRTLGANAVEGRSDLALFRAGHIVIGFAEPLTATREFSELNQAGVSLLAMELIPRITRAQSMDALSAMATIAGYESVLLGASALPKIFPMLMTAAGTITPAKVFVLGVGVAGLQAIATARRLGAVVSAYDVRPAVREQVESVGAKFVALAVDSAASEDKGGYAKAMDEEFYRKQGELLASVMKDQDVVISTAAVPGRKAPTLITKAMVEVMMPGSVIVDVAAERGGNCALTRAGETVMHGGVRIMGPLNMPSLAPFHASQMYSSNITAILKLLVREGQVTIDLEDEIIRESLVCHGSKVVHSRVSEIMAAGAR